MSRKGCAKSLRACLEPVRYWFGWGRAARLAGQPSELPHQRRVFAFPAVHVPPATVSVPASVQQQSRRDSLLQVSVGHGVCGHWRFCNTSRTIGAWRFVPLHANNAVDEAIGILGVKVQESGFFLVDVMMLTRCS